MVTFARLFYRTQRLETALSSEECAARLRALVAPHWARFAGEVGSHEAQIFHAYRRGRAAHQIVELAWETVGTTTYVVMRSKVFLVSGHLLAVVILPLAALVTAETLRRLVLGLAVQGLPFIVFPLAFLLPYLAAFGREWGNIAPAVVSALAARVVRPRTSAVEAGYRDPAERSA